MNEKKKSKKNSLAQEKGGPLKDRRNQAEQVSWDLIHTIFVELFTADLLKKKSKFYHLSVQRYLQNKLDIFSKI